MDRLKSELSIVVPVHQMAGKLGNLEATIQMARSNYLSVDFLLIHDGSHDETFNELKSISQRYGSQLFEVNYQSPGLTRNVGIRNLQTPWVAFWDSDDIGYAGNLLKAIKACPNYVNMLIGSYEERVSGKGSRFVHPRVGRDFSSNFVNPGLWRFVFRSERLEGVEFIKSRMGEDQVFLAELQIDSKEISTSRDIFYTYLTNQVQSLSQDKKAIGEVATSNLYLKNMFNQGLLKHRYQKVILLRMLLTEMKYSKSVNSLSLKRNTNSTLDHFKLLREFLSPAIVILVEILRKFFIRG